MFRRRALQVAWFLVLAWVAIGTGMVPGLGDRLWRVSAETIAVQPEDYISIIHSSETYPHSGLCITGDGLVTDTNFASPPRIYEHRTAILRPKNVKRVFGILVTSGFFNMRGPYKARRSAYAYDDDNYDYINASLNGRFNSLFAHFTGTPKRLDPLLGFIGLTGLYEPLEYSQIYGAFVSASRMLVGKPRPIDDPVQRHEAGLRTVRPEFATYEIDDDELREHPRVATAISRLECFLSVEPGEKQAFESLAKGQAGFYVRGAGDLYRINLWERSP